MSLILNDSKLCNAAEELARVTGQPIERALQEAIEARMRALDARKKKSARYEKLMRLTAEPPEFVEGNFSSLDHADMLYDGNGLPK